MENESGSAAVDQHMYIEYGAKVLSQQPIFDTGLLSSSRWELPSVMLSTIFACLCVYMYVCACVCTATRDNGGRRDRSGLYPV